MTPEGPVLEAQAGDGRVLDLDPLVGQRRGEAADVRDRPHHPQQQIDVVDGLVHQRPAAVERLVPFQPPSS